MDAIYPMYDADAFDKACAAVTPAITVEEREWLRNYLKNCGTLWAPNGVLEAAAGTGW